MELGGTCRTDLQEKWNRPLDKWLFLGHYLYYKKGSKLFVTFKERTLDDRS